MFLQISIWLLYLLHHMKCVLLGCEMTYLVWAVQSHSSQLIWMWSHLDLKPFYHCQVWIFKADTDIWVTKICEQYIWQLILFFINT